MKKFEYINGFLEENTLLKPYKDIMIKVFIIEHQEYVLYNNNTDITKIFSLLSEVIKNSCFSYHKELFVTLNMYFNAISAFKDGDYKKLELSKSFFSLHFATNIENHEKFNDYILHEHPKFFKYNELQNFFDDLKVYYVFFVSLQDIDKFIIKKIENYFDNKIDLDELYCFLNYHIFILFLKLEKNYLLGN